MRGDLSGKKQQGHQEVYDFEELDYRAQEAIIELVVSIIRNNEKVKQEA